MTEQISRALREREWQEDAPRSSIATLPEYDDSGVAAEALISRFETLPWRYELFVETPLTTEFREFLGDSTELGRGLTLLLPDERHAAEYPVPDGGPFLSAFTGRHLPKSWSLDRYYLKGDIRGFIGRTSSRQGVLNFIAKAKSLAGLLLALDICEHERSVMGRRNRTPVL